MNKSLNAKDKIKKQEVLYFISMWKNIYPFLD